MKVTLRISRRVQVPANTVDKLRDVHPTSRLEIAPIPLPLGLPCQCVLRRRVADSLDVVAVGADDEGPVVVRVVVRP